ncbi:MAG TPA: leucine zipper domain-containing protein [Flexivirga sp.]|uniref:DDE-type integrase/transposase/recombinase n=1 Tax=Flexivirga sp. TaxID=1962927 RepID=UPI002D17CB8D|nr:leucine zipper domain-containing protein [Flexivirga sp.]HWC21113.1 leucine zipper domain-containing protein [Flexivirga sp.]
MSPEFAVLVARVSRGERVNVRAECALLGVSTKTFYKYVARFNAEGVQGFYPRSRRPRSSPTKLSAAAEDALVRARKKLDDDGWDAGADQILFWLRDRPKEWPAGIELPSRSTINRVLDQRGQIVKVPQRRPRRSRHRFEADHPNTMWQMDGFDYSLASGRHVVVLQLTDDCSRFDLALRAVTSENAQDVWAAVLWASERYGLPARFLTDNGTAFSGARRGWVSALEANLRALGVVPLTSSVRHPQTCGKNERAHGTVLKWLRKRPAAASLQQLQTLLDRYREHYNQRRRKTHLRGMTPAERYALGPMDGPGSQPTPWPVDIYTAKVSDNGLLSTASRQLGVGKRHGGIIATVIRQHRQIAVFDRNQLIAEFTLTVARRRYQARNQAPPVALPKS